ncbi:hypothetical protein Tco_1459898 [Tanacetum coccineum]
MFQNLKLNHFKLKLTLSKYSHLYLRIKEYKERLKNRRAKKVTELPQTSVPLDHGANEVVHKEGVTVWKGLSLLMLAYMEYHDDLTDFVPPTPHDSPLSGGNTPGSDEDRMELIQELMETCTSLTKRVLALEEAKTTQDKGSGEKGGRDQVSNARKEVSATSVPVNVSAATPSTPPIIRTIFGDEDLTIAQTLVKMRSEKAKEKEKGVVLIDEKEPPGLNRSTATLQPLLTIDPKDKGKCVLVEEEPKKPVKVKRRDQGLA